jgi:hypothetical protein
MVKIIDIDMKRKRVSLSRKLWFCPIIIWHGYLSII